MSKEMGSSHLQRLHKNLKVSGHCLGKGNRICYELTIFMVTFARQYELMQ